MIRLKKFLVKRGELPLNKRYRKQCLFPLLISRGQVAGVEDLSRDKNIPNILNERVLSIIERMENDMIELKLNKDFDLDINKYLIKPKQTSEL